MDPTVNCSTIYDSRDMEATQTPTGRGVDKDVVVHTYTGILAIKRNESESVLARQINLEPVIQSEVSQKEKNKYCVLMHKFVIQKDGTDEPVCIAALQTCGQTQGRGGWDELREQH